VSGAVQNVEPAAAVHRDIDHYARGLARQFIRNVAATERHTFDLVSDRWLPDRRKLMRTAKRREEIGPRLVAAMRDYDNPYRLGPIERRPAGRFLVITETRLETTDYREAEWEDRGWEKNILIVSSRLETRIPEYKADLVALISFHALEQFFARLGYDTPESDLVDTIRPLAASRWTNGRIRTPRGDWASKVVDVGINGKQWRLNAVRTFLS
jgi:hypothetical protein